MTERHTDRQTDRQTKKSPGAHRIIDYDIDRSIDTQKRQHESLHHEEEVGFFSIHFETLLKKQQEAFRECKHLQVSNS